MFAIHCFATDDKSFGNQVAMSEAVIDALVVGAGFGGIYQLKKLKDQGLDAIAIDVASDVGGTWYWNRYPGAMSEYVCST